MHCFSPFAAHFSRSVSGFPRLQCCEPRTIIMPQKRTLDAFFAPTPKKARPDNKPTALGQEETGTGTEPVTYSTHHAYPIPIRELPSSLSEELASLPARPGKEVNDQPDLDLLYFEPYVPGYLAKELFRFLREELPFYRVEYKINRGGIHTDIRTPRYTTVFGLDETSRFADDGSVVDAKTSVRVADKRYDRYPPRPIPECLDDLRKSTEAATGCQFNFCLVNYYANGSDSISFHSDDERFLGPDPAIASFSLGARRDFLMKHKPVSKDSGPHPAKTQKFPLGSGDMVLMRGPTQSKWLHSIPKRSGKNLEDGGRINITFRRAMVKDGTENYYNYNVGNGSVYRWDKASREMRVSKS